MKFRIHPLFFALALVLVALGRAQAFLCAFAAVCLHEAGHALVARIRGYTLGSVVLLPYGAMMSADDELDSVSAIAVGIAGPLANLFFAVATLGLWWLAPSVYPYTRPFLYANLSIALFNLLPVYPLDGSRVVLGLARNRLKAVKGMQIAGTVTAVVLFAGFVASCFTVFNPTLGIIAVFLFYGATSGSANEAYRSVLAYASKNYALGVTEKRVYVSSEIPLARLFHHVNSRSVTVFCVVSAREGVMSSAPPEILCELSEERIRTFAAGHRLSATLGECLAETANPKSAVVGGTALSGRIGTRVNGRGRGRRRRSFK